MKWVYIEDIAQYDGQDVEVRGWVYNKRSSGKVRFLLVRDGTGLIQATVFSAEKDSPLFQKFDRLTQESSLIVRGRIREDKRAPGGYELTIADLDIVQVAEDYPITLKEHSTPSSWSTATSGSDLPSSTPSSASGPRSSRPSATFSTGAGSA